MIRAFSWPRFLVISALTHVLLVLAVTAWAQPTTAPIESYEVRFYAQGAPSPTQTYQFDASLATCGQTAQPAGSTTNPTGLVWDDPSAAGLVCAHDFASGAPLFSLPVGNYEGTLIAVNTAGASGESNRAPFDVAPVVVAPGAPSGLRFER